MLYFEAPERFSESWKTKWLLDRQPVVFLAGGVTDCPDWQKIVTTELMMRGDVEAIVCNPRRGSFDTAKKDIARQQIEWEFDALWCSDIIAFWFCKATVQPIALFELGARLGQRYSRGQGAQRASMLTRPKILIGIEPGYPRETDVIIQTELAMREEPVISRDLPSFTERLALAIKRYNAVGCEGR